MKYDVPSENIEEEKLSLLGVGKVRAFLLVSLKKDIPVGRGQIVAKYDSFCNLMGSLTNEG